jgi:hypothetical protein
MAPLLEPGDVLYIPRGSYHEARATDVDSIHLTIGMYPVTWKHLLLKLVDAAAGTGAALPRAAGRIGSVDQAKMIGGELRDQLDTICGTASPPLALESLAREFLSSLDPVPGANPLSPDFMNSRNADIGPDSCFHLRHGALGICIEKGDKASFLFPGGEISGPSNIAPFLTFLSRCNHFGPTAVASFGLPVGTTRQILSQLVAAGYLSQVTHHKGSVPPRAEESLLSGAGETK